VTRSIVSLLLAALVAAACTDSAAPDNRVPPPQSIGLRSIEVDGPDDVPLEEGETMPDEFHSAPLIETTNMDVGFNGTSAYAVASMRYYATHGKVFVRLRVKHGDTVVGEDTTTSHNDELFPMWGRVVARVVVSVADSCGYRADALGSFSAWMGFPIPRTGDLFTWGRILTQLPGIASQDPCPPTFIPVSDSSDYDEDFFINEGEEPEGDDPYDGTCQTCQLWLAFINGYFYSYWWECVDEDPSYCESLNEAR
jgi:hypothetical protein